MYSLHLTHPKWTHTRSSGQPCYSAWGAVGGSVPCSRTPQSWYWGWRARCTFTPSAYNPWTGDSNPQPLDYKSDSLTIRPRLPLNSNTPLCQTFSDSNIIHSVNTCTTFISCGFICYKTLNKHPGIVRLLDNEMTHVVRNYILGNV